MNGGAGDDRLKDRKGANTFSGGAGDDRIDSRDRGRERGSASSADTVNCEPGDEVRVDSNDTVNGCQADRVRGGPGDGDDRNDDDSSGSGS
jgi:hypothetical protein